MFTIENDQLSISVQPKGAELSRIFLKQYALEYLWDADPAYWAKKSPVLFPIVGQLKEDTYFYEGQAYRLPRHGFARDKNFSVTAQNKEAITFSLGGDEETFTKYPFHFRLDITYTIQDNELSVSYKVKNMDRVAMYFSIGGHPAFKVPLVAGTDYTDYQLVFNKTENAGRWPISKEGLIENGPATILNNTNILPLAKNLFEKDAVVFKHLQSDAVQLRSDKTPHGLNFQFSGFPFLGIWAAPNADFVCIEPWCGIADSVDSNQQLTDKEGIIHLAVGENFEVSWQVQFF